ncbi:MAG: lysylphosphatidylglycerol synthase transmembrane domain-containing protein [Deltaproteobacteria bacterium]|nr:lysylphosphatidylglycerol synthase transmembrane domain-containing protein [Deltaproteobacteria bacterium]
MTRVAGWRAALRSPVLKLALSAALLLALLHVTDVAALHAVLAAADWHWVVVAFALSVLSQVVSSYRWFLLTHAVGFHAPFGRVLAYYFSGMYLNLFAPGTVAGDVSRALFLAGGERRALALTTVVAHRAIGFVALVWTAALGLVVVHGLPIPALVRGVAALAIPLTLAAWLVGPRLAARLLAPGQHWRVLIERDLAPYWNDRALLILSLALAAGVHLLQIFSQIAASRALGLALPFTYFWVIVPLLNMGATLPVSWSGIGVREAGYWYALSGVGVGHDTSVAVGLLGSLVVLLTGLCGLPFFLLMRRKD